MKAVVKKKDQGLILSRLETWEENDKVKSKKIYYKDLPFLNSKKDNEVVRDGEINHYVVLQDYFIKPNRNIVLLLKEFNVESVDTDPIDYIFNYHLLEYDIAFNLVKNELITHKDFEKDGAPRVYLNSVQIDGGFMFSVIEMNKKNPIQNYSYNLNSITFYKYENDELKQTSVPLKKKGVKVGVLPAKKGYILLREYSDDGKIDEVRLEKLAF